MIFDPYHRFMPRDFVFKMARTPSDLDGYWALRRSIFCNEQSLFKGTDRGEVDDRALPLICASLVAEIDDPVVGLVRIDEPEPGLWYGSRLGVAPEFRRLKNFSPGGPPPRSAAAGCRRGQPPRPQQRWWR
jgi:putative N-acetyltransferase (TIGR04045 family)